MQQFNYTVKDASGVTRKGVVEAVDARAASQMLHEKGYVVIKVEDKKKELSFGFGGVGIGPIANFTRQLSTMVSSGLPLTESLVVLQKQTENKKLQQVIQEIADDIQGGSTFASSLSKHPKEFSVAYINVVKAGESSGTLDKVLAKMADTLEKQREFQAKVKGAFVYPVIILIAMGLVISIILIFVIPKLSELYTQLNIKLPLPTVIMIGLSDIATHFWWLIIILGAVGTYLLRRYRKTESGALVIDSLVLKVPIMGKLNRDSSLTEFTRTLGSLVAAGVPILEGLKISADVATNAIHRQAIKKTIGLVEKGAQLSKAIGQDDVFPAIIPQMIAVGEETGKIDEVLAKVAAYFELEVDHQVKN
ncbi:MAG TPA: type II secretion system F family protein, partial [Candidatus Saccharimonadales bacterium]|nr:type II secretion system F family protein [Candidatus Saccharimonadales bacterium]